MTPTSRRWLFSSVDFSGALQRLFQFFEREVGAARDIQDRRLATAAEFGSVRNLGGDIDRYHDRAVLVGVNQIVGMHGHAGNADFAAEILGVHPGMRRTDR